jgi:hypothetical protein
LCLDYALSNRTDLFLAAMNDKRSGAGAGTSTALGMRHTFQAAAVDARIAPVMRRAGHHPDAVPAHGFRGGAYERSHLTNTP